MIDCDAAELVAKIIEAFVVEYRQASNVDVTKTLLYGVLRDTSYALAFVTPDGKHSGVPLQDLLRDPSPVSQYDFADLRRLIHTLWRAENWNGEAVETGDSPVCQAVRRGMLLSISRRLCELVERARQEAPEVDPR